VNLGVVGLMIIDIVWVLSTTTPLVTCKWISYKLVRMLAWIFLYWTKEVSAMRTNGIRFFKDEAKHEPCKTTDVKVMLLVLLVF
jgi:hypothetical protein